MALRLKKQDSGPSFLLVFLFALPLARQLTELLVQAPLEVGSLGGIQGSVLGAAPGIQEPFPADALPSVGLGLVPTAMDLERQRTLGSGAGITHVGTRGFCSFSLEFPFCLLCIPLKSSPIIYSHRYHYVIHYPIIVLLYSFICLHIFIISINYSIIYQFTPYSIYFHFICI